MSDLDSFIAGLPKAELHVHQVGSASPRIVAQLAERHPGTVPTDPEALAEAVGNVVENALRYTPEGGRVVLRGGAEAHSVWLEVEDTGPGVPPEERPFIFERFYRVDPARHRSTGGTGLGLSIVRAAVTAHEGHLHASPVNTGGLAITVSFPPRQ